MIEISHIALSLEQGIDEGATLRAARAAAARLLCCKPRDIASIELRRRSIDARRKGDVHLVVTVRVSMGSEADDAAALEGIPARDRTRARLVTTEKPRFPEPIAHPPATRPVVVGAGCAGLFCALALAEAGLEPLVIERGDAAEARAATIERFNRTGALDLESNIQFGLGGAGTFSDGKLSTGTKSPEHRLILETLVEAGAPREILWDAKPHIGSDILPRVVKRIAARIRALGGEVRYRTRLTDLERDREGAVRGITVEMRERGAETARTERIACTALVLACGHSARDVFELLERRGIALRRKTFAIGVRIEHAQRAIDYAQYGEKAGHPALGPASYKLVAHPAGGRSVFTFCMCPGGTVVAAASEADGVVTNGASAHARAGRNANAALLVNVTPDDLPGASVLEGVELQRRCERAAFEAGGGAYRAPAQLLGDFLAGTPSSGPGAIKPTYPRGVTWGTLDQTLPGYVIETLRAGIPLMERRLHGFTAPDAVLTGVETRSSAPVTVVRDRATLEAVGASGLYPCGEGAGYAGGIMSAAADGIRCARALVARQRFIFERVP